MVSMANSFSFKCFQQTVLEMLSQSCGNCERDEIHQAPEMILQRPTRQAKTHSHNSLRTRSVLIPLVPITCASNTGCYLKAVAKPDCADGSHII